jgi:hypothetical protein
MLRILIADGTPAAMQAERETFGIPSNARSLKLRSGRNSLISAARRLMLPMAKSCQAACRSEILTV